MEAADVFEALLLCRTCPVRLACLEHALSEGEHYGIWGGATPDERRRLAAIADPPLAAHDEEVA